MTTAPPAPDAAWATLALPLAPAPLYDFLLDAERLLRINPSLELASVVRVADGIMHIRGRNESNEQAIDTTVEVVASAARDGLVLRYRQGIKRETRLAIVADANGALLTITEVYASPAGAGDGVPLQAVDRSLVAWAAALRAHLRRRARWGRVPGYAWLVERFWLTMPPRQRRVAWLLIWTTLLEFLVFLAVVAFYAAA